MNTIELKVDHHTFVCYYNFYWFDPWQNQCCWHYVQEYVLFSSGCSGFGVKKGGEIFPRSLEA